MFPETQWTELRHAITTGGTINPLKIEALCTTYYEPISSFIRSICPGREEAEDLTQGFMAGMAEGKYFTSVDKSEGRFRSFLCQCAKHFALNEWRRNSTQKRGGANEHVPFDEAYMAAVVDPAVEEYDKAWVGVIVQRTMDRLREDYARRGSEKDFDCFVEGLGWGSQNRSVAELAAACGKTENAFSLGVHRLKRRFGELIRAEVSSVVTEKDDIEAELLYYLKLFPENLI